MRAHPAERITHRPTPGDFGSTFLRTLATPRLSAPLKSAKLTKPTRALQSLNPQAAFVGLILRVRAILPLSSVEADLGYTRNHAQVVDAVSNYRAPGTSWTRDPQVMNGDFGLREHADRIVWRRLLLKALLVLPSCCARSPRPFDLPVLDGVRQLGPDDGFAAHIDSRTLQQCATRHHRPKAQLSASSPLMF